MAYMSQENKKTKEPLLKKLAKEYGIKVSVAVYDSSTLILNIKSGKIDFVKNYNETNSDTYTWGEKFKPIEEDSHLSVYGPRISENFSGIAEEFLEKAYQIMMCGNHNNSDIQTDYFDVGWYTRINIGNWDKRYIVTAE